MIVRVAQIRYELDLVILRWAGGAMLALGLLLPLLPTAPPLPCPLRATTGVPCPACGMTRSVTSALQGDLAASAAYNPFGLLAVAAAVALLVRPGWRRVRVPAMVLLAAAAVSWAWQLHRYGFV